MTEKTKICPNGFHSNKDSECDCGKKVSNKLPNKEEYERDYKHAMEHPHKGVICQNCPATYFHPILGCPSCGKYKDIYKPEVKEEDWEKTPLELAQLFHDTYEGLAPSFGYETRKDTKDFDPETPNGKLMVAVCEDILNTHIKPLLKENTQRVLEGLISSLEESKMKDEFVVKIDSIMARYIKDYAKYVGINLQDK